MNKKGIIAVIVVILLIIIGYKVWGGGAPSTVTNGTDTQAPGTTTIPAGVTKDTYAPVTKDSVDTSLLGRLKGASVAAAESDARVALVNGKAQFSSDGVKGSIALGDIAVSKTVGGATYAVTTLGITTGGSTSQYAVLFNDQSGTLTDKSYALIGTGVKIAGLRADEVSGGFVVTVSYTDASGKAHSKILVVEKGAFNAAKEINL
ncbi:MAG TPA: hypothetical protein VFQ72_02330 [Candidatus Paceibacterota bacterium]|nr:hypothetical protein [Candidatus Paceibacterota bacterium]